MSKPSFDLLLRPELMYLEHVLDMMLIKRQPVSPLSVSYLTGAFPSLTMNKRPSLSTSGAVLNAAGAQTWSHSQHHRLNMFPWQWQSATRRLVRALFVLAVSRWGSCHAFHEHDDDSCFLSQRFCHRQDNSNRTRSRLLLFCLRHPHLTGKLVSRLLQVLKAAFRVYFVRVFFQKLLVSLLASPSASQL